ncbi:MAG: MFS transporter [Hyphomicrobiaceae bacterium]
MRRSRDPFDLHIIYDYWHAADEAVESGWRRVTRIALTPPLRNYIAARVLEMTSKWIFRVTTPMVVWQLTHDERMLAASLACLLLPGLVTELVGGIVADSYDRRTIMISSCLGSVVCNLAIAAISLAGALSIELLLGLTVVYGGINSVSNASTKTIITAFVRKEDLATAVSLNTVVFNVAGFIGPAVAAGLIYTMGNAAAYIASAMLSLGFVALLTRIRTPDNDNSGHHGSFLAALRDGFFHVIAVRLLLLVFVFHIASIGLTRPFLEFVPAIVHHSFAGGPREAGFLFSAFGFGSICGGLWLASSQTRTTRLAAIALGAMPIFAGALLGLALSPSLPLAVVFAFAAGFGMITRGGAIQSMMQLESHPAYRGRVMALHGVMFEIGAMAGALFIGEMARAVNLTVALSACVGMLLLLWVSIRKPLSRAALLRQNSVPPPGT